MKVAHIVPKSYGLIDKDYTLLLAHLIDADTTYKQVCTAKNGYKILDNSVIELGEAVDIHHLNSIARDIGAHELILPDVFKNKEKTIESVDNAIKTLKEIYKDCEIPYKLMAVPQGNTMQEFKECLDMFLENPDIDVLGIPKLLDSMLLTSRRHVLEYLHTHPKRKNKQFHLLGMQNNLEEIHGIATAYPWVRGLDTCGVYILSRDGKKLNPLTGAPRPEKTIDFADEFSEDIKKLLDENIAVVDSWLKAGEVVNGL